ncbi:glyoxalase/bleomycin resistance/dioxygenase family protein [Cohnella endophytica]|uniref:Glyoxalase/bleomycin resistance/dioxygenase family protein n=1 Tax=Cohnella endophytica TaxID=2419778 RepID=A0A494Y9K1_9BACL|nr:VOC family protein [Cohnella endophytica]RKP57363.1 glyoxalase/bleomycin resistance/dioxygenase family protein [Cohnella endophytica]
MITRFSRLVLNTVSLQGTKQFYEELLGFEVAFESDDEIRFRPTPDFELVFLEKEEPLTPAHIAFEVPYSAFDEVVALMRERGIPLSKWPDGRTMDRYETGQNVYFRDDNGNLLEMISHLYVNEDGWQSSGPLQIMYVREIGFPVENVAAFRESLVDLFGMRLTMVSDAFTFAIGGTAHAVIASVRRRWIPISMVALPPKMEVEFQASDSAFVGRVREKLSARGIPFSFEEGGALAFTLEGYPMRLLIGGRYE